MEEIGITAIEAFNESIKQTILTQTSDMDINRTMIEIFENIRKSIEFGLFQCYHKCDGVPSEKIDKIKYILENLYKYNVERVDDIEIEDEENPIKTKLLIGWNIKLNN